jgi:MoxR-like ATPase
MTDAQIKLEILRLPLAVVMAAYAVRSTKVLNGTNAEIKSQAADFLVTKVRDGSIDLNLIRGTAPVTITNTVTSIMGGATLTAGQTAVLDSVVQSQSADRAVLDAVRVVADRAASDALKGLNSHNTLTQTVTRALAALEQDIEANRQNLDRLAVSTVDDRKVAAEVTAAIDKAFAPFKQAVIDAGAEAVIANGVSAKVIGSETALNVFGVDVKDAKGQPLMVDIWDAVDAPTIDPNFVWTSGIIKHLLLSQNTGENLWFGGEKGTGKSETARQFAAKTGRSYTRINFHKYTTTEDYVGCTGLENSATVFKMGAFMTGFVSPSTVVLLDEVSNCDAGELATLNGFLEPNSAVSFGGQVRRRAAGVLVFAADNTLCNGDQSGRYAGTRQMNSSLADRFSRVIRFEYLSKADEVTALVRHTQCNALLAGHVVDAINAARAKVETGDVIDAPSIRSAIAFIRALNVLSVDEAWASAVTARQPSESAAALDAIKAAYLNPAQIEKWI